jgi:fructokinase
MLPEGAKLGGAPANFAYHAGQFGHPAMAVSALGNDELGDQTVKELDKKGLKYIMPRVDYPTGTVGVELDAAGVPTYDIKTNVAWDNLPFTPEVEAAAQNCSAVCFGSLAQRCESSRETIRKFLEATPDDCLKIFDINLRSNFYTKEVIQDSLRRCNILKINDEELVVLGRLFGIAELDFDNKCQTILNKYNLEMLVLTCGTQGSYVFAPGMNSFLETPKVKVADTVGAGDSFTGAFTSAILSGKSIREAHELAVKVSAYVCTQRGAMPVLPKEFTAQISA